MTRGECERWDAWGIVQWQGQTRARGQTGGDDKPPRSNALPADACGLARTCRRPPRSLVNVYFARHW